MVSSRGADPSAPGDDAFAVYLRAKGKADEELQRERPGVHDRAPRLADRRPRHGARHARRARRDGSISRDDVAAVLAFTVHDPAVAGVTFEVVAGETPIEQALAACRSAPAA